MVILKKKKKKENFFGEEGVTAAPPGLFERSRKQEIMLHEVERKRIAFDMGNPIHQEKGLQYQAVAGSLHLR